LARTRFTRSNGLYSKQDLENLEKWAPTTKRAVIVGGGLIGIELAEMLLVISQLLLVREKSFECFTFGESKMINRHILEHHID
jgi:NADH dehydrogenase FAD-containing subunit